MCIIDLPDPGLMRAVELADFMDEVDSADPELLTLGPGGDSPRSPDAVLMSAPVDQGDYRVRGARGADDSDSDAAPRSVAAYARGFPASGSSCGDSAAWGAPPAKEARASRAQPSWMLPDSVVLESALDKLLAETQSASRARSSSRQQEEEPARSALTVSIEHADASQGFSSPMASSPGSSSSPTYTASSASSSSSPPPPAELITFRLKDAERSRMRRKRQKNEFVQLRLRIKELEEELAALRRREIAESEEALEKAIVHNLVPMPALLASESEAVDMEVDECGDDAQAMSDAADGSIESKPPTGKLWGQLAEYQKEELQKSRLQNLRLRAEAEQQLRVLKQIEVALRSIGKMSRAQRRGLLTHRGVFRNENALYDFLRANMPSLYMETDRVFKTSGLAEFDGDMVQMGVPHAVGDASPGSDNVQYVENMDSKVFPFDLGTVDQAVWHSLTSNDSSIHPGFYKVIEATDDVVSIKIADYVRLPGAETLVTVWLTARRYREDDRIVTTWNAFAEMEGPVFLKLYERGWSVLRPLLPTNEARSPSMCVLQTLMRVAPELTETFAPEELAPPGTLLIGWYHRTVVVMHHVLEKLLLTDANV